MNIRLKKLITGTICTAAIACGVFGQSFDAWAATGKIAFSDPSVSAGEEASVNMKISSAEVLGKADVMLSYDASTLEFISGTDASGGAGSIRIVGGSDTANTTTLTYTLKFKALQAGTSKISVSTQEVYDGNSQIVTIEKEGESAVTITGRSNASKESALSDLKISPGTLTPAFSPEVEAYTATVGADTTKIVVSATSTDEKAQVAISGNEELQMGDNVVVCKVIAEDGATVKNYTIQVTKGEGAVSDTTTAAAENGVKVETLAQTVTIIPLDDGVAIPEGFAECSIRIDDQEVIGWVWASEKDPKYCVFYGVTEAGEKDFYRYDLTQKTMQRYFQDPTSAAGVSMEQYTSVAEEYNSLLHDYKIRLYMIFALFALAVILLFALVILWLRKRQVENEDYGDSYKDEKPKEELQLRKKPVHRISKEEEYLRGLEAEEEAAKTRPEKSGQAEKTEQLKKTDSSEKTEETDDDDFEFIDLGL